MDERFTEYGRDTRKGKFWVSFLGIIIDILIVISIIGSVIIGIALGVDRSVGLGSPGLGIVAAIVGIFWTLLSVARLKIFLGMAEDVRDMRNSLEERR